MSIGVNLKLQHHRVSHTKASLIGSSISIPITDGRLNLGTWQGTDPSSELVIFLHCTFRHLPHGIQACDPYSTGCCDYFVNFLVIIQVSLSDPDSYIHRS